MWKRFAVGVILGFIFGAGAGLPYAFGSFSRYAFWVSVTTILTGLLLALIGDRLVVKLLMWLDKHQNRLP